MNSSYSIFIEPYHPYTILNPSPNCTQLSAFTAAQASLCWTGALAQSLFYISAIGNFSFDFYRTSHFFNDSEHLNSVWMSGLQLLEEKRVDMLLSYYAQEPNMSAQAWKAVFPEYLSPRNNRLRWAVRILDVRMVEKNDSGLERYWEFARCFQVFGNRLWMAVLAALVSISVMIFVLDATPCSWKGFLQILEQNFRMLTMRDTQTEAGRKSGVECLQFSWSVTSLILASVYCGSIITATTIDFAWKPPFRTLVGMEEAGYR